MNNLRNDAEHQGTESANDTHVRRVTGYAAVATGFGSALLIPLYFTDSRLPTAANVLTRNLINIFLCTFLIVFFTGLSRLIRKADAAYEWIASLVFGGGLTYVAVLLVGISLEVGAILGQPAGTIDPTIDGPLAKGAMLIHGSIGRALTVVILTAAGYSIRGTRIMPNWLGQAAYVIAGINLVFIPSMYFGTNAAQFYSAIGWGNSALVASMIAYWIMATGIVSLRQLKDTPLETKVVHSPRV